MKKLLVIPVLLLAVTAVASSVSDIDGLWKGSFQTPQGEMQITFKFETDGTTLTGYSDPGMGDTFQFENGEVAEDGKTFSFELPFQQMTISHKGTLNEDGTITLEVLFGEQESSMTLTKVEE